MSTLNAIPDMPSNWIPKSVKTVDPGRIVNFVKCIECNKNFDVNCVSCSNYSVPYKFKRYTYKEFAEFYLEYLKQGSIFKNDDLVDKFMRQVNINFAGLFWQVQDHLISFYDRYPDRGPIASIDLSSGDINGMYLSKTRRDAITQIRNKLNKCQEYADKLLSK